MTQFNSPNKSPGPPPIPEPSPHAARQAPRRRDPIDMGVFARRLRYATLYPTFRNLVEIFYVIGLILAGVLILIGAASLLVDGTLGIGGLAIGAVSGIICAIFAKVSRELSLMLADLSDAAVYIASQQSQEHSDR